jgi:hypothetical protein
MDQFSEKITLKQQATAMAIHPELIARQRPEFLSTT